LRFPATSLRIERKRGMETTDWGRRKMKQKKNGAKDGADKE
jgi:hypothetical protein